MNYSNIFISLFIFTNVLKIPLVKSFIIKHKNLHTHTHKCLTNNDSSYPNNKKKIISISPGGYKGFYQFGVCKYIKEHYNLDDYVFSGASAGSWNSLALCCKRDINEIQQVLLRDDLHKVKSIKELKDVVKNKILDNFKSEDFELDKLYIGTTAFENYQRKTIIYGGFDNLEDAVNCCIASSHIPLVTGGIHHIYRNVPHYDGGFSKHPYLNDEDIVIHIRPNMWKEGNKHSFLKISDYTTLLSRNNYSFEEMIEEGYNDSREHKKCLDNIFYSS